jgi:hypothetical protein
MQVGEALSLATYAPFGAHNGIVQSLMTELQVSFDQLYCFYNDTFIDIEWVDTHTHEL